MGMVHVSCVYLQDAFASFTTLSKSPISAIFEIN